MEIEIWSLPNARGCFPRQEEETESLFHLAASNFSAVLGILTQLAGPSAWGKNEGARDSRERGPSNRWGGGGLLSRERKSAALKGRKAVARRT